MKIVQAQKCENISSKSLNLIEIFIDLKDFVNVLRNKQQNNFQYLSIWIGFEYNIFEVKRSNEFIVD